MSSREALLYGAKLSEKIERYEDSIDFMKKVIEMGDTLTTDERNLLSVGYKNLVSALRNGWRNIDTKSKKKTPEDIMTTYRDYIDGEICRVSDEVISLIDTKLLNSKLQVEGEVFYKKMQADYYRYKAETHDPEVSKTAAAKSLEFYEAANADACKEGGLGVANPIRLGLSLNFAVFLCEIQGDKNKACQHAKKAYDDAIGDINQCTDDTYKESSLIMQLLRENLASWTSEMQEDESNNGQA